MKKLPDSKSATVILKRKTMQEEDTTSAACKHTEDQPTAISEHVNGLNETITTADTRKVEAANNEHAEKCDEATTAEDKERNEASAAAAKKNSDMEGILRSIAEVMACIDERRIIKKDD